jgi:hypothetical protein
MQPDIYHGLELRHQRMVQLNQAGPRLGPEAFLENHLLAIQRPALGEGWAGEDLARQVGRPAHGLALHVLARVPVPHGHKRNRNRVAVT